MTVSLEKVLISLKGHADLWLERFLSHFHAAIPSSVPMGLTESFLSIHCVPTLVLLDLQGAERSTGCVSNLRRNAERNTKSRGTMETTVER